MSKENLKGIFRGDKAAIYFVTLFVAFGVGIVNPVSATHMALLDVSKVYIGLGSFLYYAAIVFGTLLLRKTMQNNNLKVMVVLGSSVAAIGMALFPFSTNIILWLVLKAIIGAGVSFVYVGVQTMLHRYSHSASLGLISGIYSTFFALGFIMGAVIGPILYESFSLYPFLVASGSLFLLIFTLLALVRNSVIMPSETKQKVYKKISYPILSIAVYGFSEAVIMNLLPVYLISQNIPKEMTGYVLGAFILGAFITTIPFTILSDKIGRKKTIGLCLAIGTAAMIALILSSSLTLFIILGFFIGSGIGPIYAISLAIVAQNLPKNQLASGNALFTMSISIGASFGPLASSFFMEYIGSKFIFVTCLALFVLLLIKSFSKEKSSETFGKASSF